jgi:phosphate-selective porin
MINRSTPTGASLLLRALVLAVVLLAFAGTVSAADAAPSSDQQQPAASDGSESTEKKDKDEEEAKKEKSDKSPIKATYKNGLRIESEDGDFAARIRWRAQLRLTDLTSDDLVGEEDGVEEEAGFNIRRARFKLDGHAYRPWLKYYLEYGIAASVMLTLQLEVQKSDQIGLRAGQFKVPYNRERVDSSGKQQFVDRSIVNNPFTIDRQTGLNLQGHLFKGTLGDSKYNFGVYTGTGRGGDLEDDEQPMYVGRWQWNFLKRDLGFSQSDIARRKKPAASLALAAASNVGRYTRFSSSGGGQLPGFETPEEGQRERYKLEQWMAEFAYHGRGLSLQGEYHYKQIDDRVDQMVTELEGYYAQIGYFFHGLLAGFPEPLELALRVAQVDSTEGIEVPADREATVAANWFFNGHDNKLTFDVSHLKSTLAGGNEDEGWRARLQWDISF